MWSSGQYHNPSNVASDNHITKIDHPIQSTHHYIISHGPTDSAHIHAGNVSQPAIDQAYGPTSINQKAPSGSLFLNTTLDDPQFGRHTLYMNRGNNDWQAVSEKIVYNVVQYGAVADGGVTDCTEAFQRCLDAAQSMQTKYSMAKVWIPRGNYLFMSTLVFNKRGRITFE
jgi:polygalacturonase